MFTFPLTGESEYAANGEWIDLLSAANQGSGTDWVNPENALLSDDAWATQAGGSKQLALKQLAKPIPPGKTIVGIALRHERHISVGANVAAPLFRLTKDGINGVGVFKAGAVPANTTDAYEIIGGGSDMWSTTWTAAEINAATFGALLGESVTSGTYYLDHVQIAIYYF